MTSFHRVLMSALMFLAFSAPGYAVPPATDRDFPAYPGSVLLSDERNPVNAAMTLIKRKYSTEASADEVFDFYKTRLVAAGQKDYAVAVSLAPGEVSGTLAMTGAVYDAAFLSAASQEIRLAFAKRKKAAGTDWVKSAQFLWSSEDANGGTNSFSLQIVDQSVSDDDPSHYSQKTQISLSVTSMAKATASGADSLAGLAQLGQKSQAQVMAAQGVVETTLAQDLFGPARSGTSAQISAALQAGGSIDARDQTGRTALMLAAANNPDPEVISTLLAAGAVVNDIDTLHLTPLMLASDTNTAAVVSKLLGAGADVKAAAETGYTSLYMAAGDNTDPGVISALAKAGADVRLAYAKLSETPLHAAVRAGNTVAVSELLRYGAGAELKSPDGVYMLASAMKQPKPAIISALIKAGADVNAKDKDSGSTALVMAAAARVDDVTVYRLLLNSGARVNDANSVGKTALHIAAEACANPEVLSVLIAAKADLKAKDAYGHEPAFYARNNPALSGTPQLAQLERAAR